MSGQPYLPAILGGGAEPGWCTLAGTFVATDVTGFTPLSERLAKSGRIGAEVLGASMDCCFTGLIDAVTPFGGDVLFFGGDALFVAFLGDEHARRAVDGAVAMMGALRAMVPLATPLGSVRVTMSAGVATGDATLVVGDGPQRPLFLTGSTVSRTVGLESRARPGEVRIDRATADHVDDAHRRPEDEDSWVVTMRRSRPSPAGPTAVGAPLCPSRQFDEHLPAALRDALLRGDAPKEHRQVAIAFVRVTDLDRLGAVDQAATITRASVLIGEACDAFDVSWIETDVAADGATIVIAGGVPHQRDDDELRVVATARQIVETDIGAPVSIGVHRGTAFVGDIGHPRRRTYGITGLTTITAARLTGAAQPAGVLASADVVGQLGYRYDAGPELELAVKGRRQPVRARTIGALAATRPPTTETNLVGRRSELAALGQAVEAHSAGRGSVIEIIGEPGMGKTRLLRSFLAAAPPPRVRVDGELALSVVPFGVLAGPLRTAVAADAAGVRSVAESTGDLAPLLGPVLGLDIPSTVASQAIEPTAIPAIRAELMVGLLRDSPGLMVVEDAHWLDPATVELLGAVAGPLADDGWLIVIARRPDTAPITPRAVPLELGPLDDDDVGRLVTAAADRPLSDAMLDAIVRLAGGNALFAHQLARSAVGPVEVGLPESAERLVGARIDRLPAELRTRLRRASVLGHRVELDVLEEMTADAGMVAEAGWAGLEEFVDRDGNHVEFRQDLFRLAAYEGLSFAERSRLHRIAADVLERRPGTPAAVLAEHSLHAGRADRVVQWASRAADEAEERAAFVDAARLRRMAAESARAAGLDRQARAAHQVALARSYETLAEVGAAERAYRQALATELPAERSAIRARLAWLSLRNDDLPRARRRVAAAMRHIPANNASGAVLRAELTVIRAAIRGVAGDRRGSDEDCRWAAEEARRLGNDDLRGQALMQLALNAELTDDRDVEVLLGDALPLLERCGKRREVATLYLNRGITHMVRGRWPAALASFESAAAGFRRCGYVLGAIFTDVNRGGLLLEQGHPLAAVELFNGVVRRARAAGHTRIALFASGSAHRAHAWLGETSAAILGLTEAYRALDDHGHRSEADDVDAYLVEVLVLAGRFDEALDRAVSLLRRLGDRSDEVVFLTTKRLAVVAAHLAGDPGALSELERVLKAARADGCGIEIARCLQALETCSRPIDEGWQRERAEQCCALGVTWMPPVTFAGPSATPALSPAEHQRFA